MPQLIQLSLFFAAVAVLVATGCILTRTVGATVPSNLKTYALPPPLIYEMPKLERYTHLKLKGQVLIVNPMTSKIVDMFPAT